MGAAAGQAGGDVPFEDTLASVGKTVGAAVGLLETDIAQDIGAGRVLAGALRP